MSGKSSKKFHVILMPGFLGFAHLGNFRYYHHVETVLDENLRKLGVQADIHAVTTQPTARVGVRAGQIFEQIRSLEGDLYLIGHSSGGLDALLLSSHEAAQHVRPSRESDPIDSNLLEPITKRIRGTLTLATPHHGTPLAEFFQTVFGSHLLRLFSLVGVYALRFGHLPTGIAVRLAGVLVRADDIVGGRTDMLDHIFDELLHDFTPERREQVRRYLAGIDPDQGLLKQLTPAGARHVQDVWTPRDDIRFGSVVAWGASPSLKHAAAQGVKPYHQAAYQIYRTLWRITANTKGKDRIILPQSAVDQFRTIGDGKLPGTEANDGFVPVRSQVFGELVHVARSDHLDLLGHFHHPDHQPPHFDLLPSGSFFRRNAFEALWRDVASFVADTHFDST